MADLGALLGAAGIGGMIGKAVVQLELDTAKYNAELRTAEAETKATTASAGSSFSRFGGLAQAGLLAAGTAAVAFAAYSVKAFMEAQQVMAQTENVLKSTGGAAGVTAQQVTGLADSISKMTGIDDEAVQASENLLLTFRSVRNEAGAGNDIFDQTTRAITDMATAMNDGAVPSMADLHTTTIQVGKALNDPIQGMTALRRVGVSFTEQQVEQITKMQESGDLMGAQKLILAELSQEFGGAAEAAGNTFAGSMAKLNVSFEEAAEKLGAALVPLLQNLVDGIIALMPFIEGLITGFIQLGHYIANVVHWLGYFFDAIGRGVQPTDEMVDILGKAAGNFLDVAGGANKAAGSTEKLLYESSSLSDWYQKHFNPTLEETADATKEAKHRFDDFEISLEDVATQTDMTRREVVKYFNELEQNSRKLLKASQELLEEKWINPDFVQYLATLGPQAITAYTSLNKDKQQEIQADWEDSNKKTNQANRNLVDIYDSLQSIGNRTTKHTIQIKYDYVDFDPTKPGMGGRA